MYYAVAALIALALMIATVAAAAADDKSLA